MKFYCPHKNDSAFNRVWKWLVLGVSLISPLVFASQKSDLIFEQLFLEHGLSQSIVQCICQDRTGFMWFGTEDGLNKFDGYQFTVLRHNPTDTNSLSYNNVTALCEDRAGILWIGTFYGGLNRYNPRTRQFRRYQNEPDNPKSLSHNNINVITEDQNGNLWVGTDNGLNQVIQNEKDSTTIFMRYFHDPHNPHSLSDNTIRSLVCDRSGALWVGTDNGLNKLIPGKGPDSPPTFTRFQRQPGHPHSLSHNEIYAIVEDRAGILWIGTNGGGLNRFDLQTNQFKHYQPDPQNPESLSHNEVYVILEDRSGALWIGTNGGGLNIFDPKTETFQVYQHNPLDPGTISYNEIRAIYEDRSGLIWIGTYGGGIDKVDRGKTQFKHYEPNLADPNSLNQPIVWSIYEDEAGILWIGTHGGGLNRFDRTQNQWQHYRHNPDDPSSLSHDIVRVVYPDQAGYLWLATHGGGINRFNRKTGKFTRFVHDPNDPTSLAHDEIRCIYEDRSGTLWVGTYGRGLDKLVVGPASEATFFHYRYDPQNPRSLSSDFVRVIYQDETGIFWIGTEGGGLNRFDKATGTFQHYRANPYDSTCLNNDYIFSIHDDEQGHLWLGTWGGGLNKFDKRTERFTHYTEADGLTNAAIYGILEDAAGNLWLSTNNGLSRFNPRTKTFKNYSVEDGLQSNEFNGGAYFKSRSGEMFFGGINGFNAFNPNEIRDNQFIPPVIITAFTRFNREVIFEKPLSEIKTLQLSYRDYVFSFEFAALDFTAPEKNQYAYKMEGLDQDWLFTDARKRFATYTTLTPGRYLFRVKGSNNDGVWNETGASLQITITPPLSQTWWFRFVVILLIVAVGYILIRRRLKNVQLKTELQAAHDAQMSIMPHSDPRIPGFDITAICIPANTVGGDFFDYFWLNEEKTKFGIAVGDVSGKAMESAMTAIMTTGMLYSKVEPNDISIKKLMTSLNRPIYSKTTRQMFTALCLAAIDLNTKELIFTNAGLIEPILKSGNSVEFLETTGPKHPLGLVPEVIYEEKTVQLKSGDTLIFITDGIPEAQNKARALYGDERMKLILQKIDTSQKSAREIKEAIIRDVKHFTGKSSQHDDMTLVVIKCL